MTKASPISPAVISAEFFDPEALEGVLAWVQAQEQTINVGSVSMPGLDCLIESSAGWLNRLLTQMLAVAQQPRPEGSVLDIYDDLSGIDADGKYGAVGAPFDAVALKTLRTAMDKLAHIGPLAEREDNDPG